MSEIINITLSVEELLAAGKTLAGDWSPISLFWNEGGGAPPPSLMHNGALRPDLLPAFQAIAHARLMKSCAYLCADGLLDINFYFPPDGKPAVSLSMADDGVRLRSPAVAEDTLIWMIEQAGDSILQVCDFEARLPLSEAYTLFALVDVARRKAMAGMDGNSQDDPTIVKVEELDVDIIDLEENAGAGLQWMAPHFAQGLGLQVPDQEALEKSIRYLAQKGYLTIKGELIELSEAMIDLASKFLLVEGHLRLRSVEAEAEGQTQTIEVRGLRGRGNATVLWSDDGQDVHLMGTSPAQMIAIVEDFITHPGDDKTVENMLTAKDSSVNFEKSTIENTEVRDKRSRINKKDRKKRPWWATMLIIVGVIIVAFLLFLLYAYS
jgi:hypothetical protein